MNLRPLDPQSSALPSCATARYPILWGQENITGQSFTRRTHIHTHKLNAPAAQSSQVVLACRRSFRTGKASTRLPGCRAQSCRPETQARCGQHSNTKHCTPPQKKRHDYRTETVRITGSSSIRHFREWEKLATCRRAFTLMKREHRAGQPEACVSLDAWLNGNYNSLFLCQLAGPLHINYGWSLR